MTPRLRSYAVPGKVGGYMDPRRVALVSSSYHPHVGGVEQHVRSVARELLRRGHDVEVWTVDRGEHLGVREVDGVRVRYLPTPLPARSAAGVGGFLRRLPGTVVAWRRALRALRPEVLHVQCFGPNGVYAYAVARMTGTPLVVSSHGETFADDHGLFDRAALIAGALRRALGRACLVTGCSEVVLDDLRHRFGLRDGVVVPNGVEAAAVPVPRHPDQPPMVLALGRLERTKGFDLLVAAFAEADLPAGSSLVIAGEGSARSALEHRAADLGVADRVVLPGSLSREDVTDHLARASVVVVPSRREAFGMVVLEAWQAGVPVVVTDRDGPATLVTDGVDGLVADPEDPAALGSAIRRVLTDGELAESLVTGGTKAVVGYTWDRVAATYEEAYDGCTARPAFDFVGDLESRSGTETAVDTGPMSDGPMPTASVVVATYCRPDHVRTCLQHLARQTVRPLETVVVDSSPDDLTREVVAEFPDVGYLRNERGAGTLATSRAIGFGATTGDVVAYVDDDAFAAGDWLEHLLAPYRDPLVAAVGGRARNGRPGEDREGLDEIGLLLPSGRLTGNFSADPGHLVETDHMLGANMSYRRSVAESLGGVRDHYPGTCLREDADMPLRMRHAGYRVVYTPAAVVDHVAAPYPRGQRFDLRYTYYAQRNHVVLLSRTLGRGTPHLRRYWASALREVGSDLGHVGKALREPGDLDRRRQLRAVGGTAARATVKLAGLAAGGLEAARLHVVEGRVEPPRAGTNDHRSPRSVRRPGMPGPKP